MAIVSATEGGGAVGGGCHAGINVVGSPSARPASAGGGATIVAATSEPFEPCQPGIDGAGAAASGGALAPAESSASVDSAGAGLGALHCGADDGMLHGAGGAAAGGGGAKAAGWTGSG